MDSLSLCYLLFILVLIFPLNVFASDWFWIVLAKSLPMAQPNDIRSFVLNLRDEDELEDVAKSRKSARDPHHRCFFAHHRLILSYLCSPAVCSPFHTDYVACICPSIYSGVHLVGCGCNVFFFVRIHACM